MSITKTIWKTIIDSYPDNEIIDSFLEKNRSASLLDKNPTAYDRLAYWSVVSNELRSAVFSRHCRPLSTVYTQARSQSRPLGPVPHHQWFVPHRQTLGLISIIGPITNSITILGYLTLIFA